MKPKTECIDLLRRTAVSLATIGDWLILDCLHSLKETGELSSQDQTDYTPSELAGMDLSMAREALESLVWWLRKAADDWEKEGGGDEPAGDSV